jgi:hypothetical protein
MEEISQQYVSTTVGQSIKIFYRLMVQTVELF